MRKPFVLSILFFLFISSCLTGLAIASDERVTAVKKALARFICYTNFWYGGEYLQGAPLDFELKFEGDRFYITTNDEKMKSEKNDERVVGIYEGSVKNGIGMVEHGLSFDIKHLEKPLPQYNEHRRHFETGPIIKASMIVPKDCTPRYDPMTPRKEILIDDIVATFQRMLRRYAAEGLEKYPDKVTLVIADFNLDYQFTFVIIEPVKEVYSVTLHDWDDYQGDRYGRDGGVLTGERTMNVFSRETLREVKRHAIRREIRIR